MKETKNPAKCSCGKVLPEFGEAGGFTYVCAKCSAKRVVYANINRIKIAKRGVRRDPEAIIQEEGAEKLSKTAAGRAVLANARQKYKAELIQPHEPEFKAYWGKTVERREKDMAEVRAESQRLKREAGMDQA